MSNNAEIAQDVSSDVTNVAQFVPTPHMIVWLDTAIRLQSDNISAISDECTVSRNTWYTWIKDDNFIKWFNEEWEKKVKAQGWRLDVIGMRNAEKDYRYWEGMQKIRGKLTNQEQPNPFNQQNNYFIGMNDEQLRNYIESKQRQLNVSFSATGDGEKSQS